MKRNNMQVSFHYAVDDLGAIAVIPENRNAWHAGDGPEGEGNRKGISIEICYSAIDGELFDKSEINAARLVAEILTRYGWGIERVKKHDEFSATSCPHRTKALGWERFLCMVRKNLTTPAEENADTFYSVSVLVCDEAEAKRVEELLFAGGYLPTISEIALKRKDSASVPQSPEVPPDPIPEPDSVSLKVGDSVKVKHGAKTYTGGSLASFVYNRIHTVKELSSDRAVIAYNGVITAAVRVEDLDRYVRLV